MTSGLARAAITLLIFCAALVSTDSAMAQANPRIGVTTVPTHRPLGGRAWLCRVQVGQPRVAH